MLDNCDQRVEKLDTFFENRFANTKPNQLLSIAIKTIKESGGNSTIEMVCDATGLNHKQLERQFIRHVGLAPKKFARIIRFFHTHKHLTKEGLDNLCSKVLEKGYYDQAHFNREYKAFTGLKPTSDLMSIFYNTK